MDVTVVGAGVIGLTTAVTLEERGHRVQVVAAASGAATTSSIAAAVWFPYRVGPPGKVTRWATRTRHWLEELARAAPAAGVDILTCYEITNEALAIDALDVANVPSPVAGAPHGWRFSAPRAQPSLFLPYLESQLRAPIERRVVRELGAEPGDAIVNCTGLASRELADDDQLYALLGQIVIAERGDTDPAISVTDDRDPDAIFYIIPRRDEVVLGGCALPFPPGATPEASAGITARILAHAKRLGISVGAVRTERVGLRPCRSEVRLERDPQRARVIHNYGHGGAGFTLCRGCAEDVAALLA